jgi:hypothetical protein
VNTYEYSCSHCNYFIETSGLWPYYGHRNKKPGKPGSAEDIPGPIDGPERWGVPVYFLDNFLFAEEFVASMLSKYHAYRWLEANGYERCLIEDDI